mmetsp:Transcript_901/g.2162  ORF Transcript_901/g.2162 Transcript_901/m.2162 type:complete len:101 (+) Transcript_901:253-555(+)
MPPEGSRKNAQHRAERQAVEHCVEASHQSAKLRAASRAATSRPEVFRRDALRYAGSGDATSRAEGSNRGPQGGPASCAGTFQADCSRWLPLQRVLWARRH